MQTRSFARHRAPRSTSKQGPDPSANEADGKYEKRPPSFFLRRLLMGASEEDDAYLISTRRRSVRGCSLLAKKYS
jgi:hypothetical protein